MSVSCFMSFPEATVVWNNRLNWMDFGLVQRLVEVKPDFLVIFCLLKLFFQKPYFPILLFEDYLTNHRIPAHYTGHYPTEPLD